MFIENLKLLYNLLRVKQYVKNLLIFAPCFFAGVMFDYPQNNIQNLIIVLVLFSMVTSFIYILNDIKDVDFDKNHPVKKERPVASGKISSKNALCIAFFVLIAGLLFSFYIDIRVFYLELIYILINLLYIYKVKEMALLDVVFVALGYIIRLFIGSVVCSVKLSNWIIILTFLLAMFLAFSKRYDDLKYNETRLCIKDYNKVYIEMAMCILAAVSIVCYLQYSIAYEIVHRLNNEYLYITSFFVILGFLRYFQIAIVKNQSDSPTNIIYNDKFLKILCFLWFITYGVIIYF